MIKLRFLNKACFLILITCFYKPTISYAQCVGCTTNITANSAANLTVAVGQTLCIGTGVTMSGQIFLNGGVLCNNGTINNLKLNSGKGRVNNYGIAKNIESSIVFAGNVSVYSYAASQITFTTLTINMNTADSLFFNLYNGGKVTFSGDLSISSKKLSIVNGVLNPSAPGNLTPTLFNIGSNLSVNNATLSLVNKSSGRLNVSGSVNLSNGGKRTIINLGILNIFNALNLSGASVGPTLIDNGGNLSITNSFSCTATSANGTFILRNSDVATSVLTVGQDLVLSILNCTTTNNGILTVNGNINYNKGNFTNSNNLSCVNFSISGTASPYVNDGKSTITNLNIFGTGKLTNNSLLDISQNFNNSGSGRITLGAQSALKTLNYSNTSTDTIFGVPESTTDTTIYARIYITGSSTNSGPMKKKMMIFDESLVNTASNIGYGFDVITNPANIDPAGPRFIKATVSPGTSGLFDNRYLSKYFGITATASTYNLPCNYSGGGVTLNAAFGIPFYTALYGYNSYYTQIFSLPTFNWQPGNLTGATQIVNPTTTTTYIVSSFYYGFNFSTAITINVNNVNVTVAGGPDVSFAMPDVVTLNTTITGGTAPYTYLWTPNSFFVNGTNNTQQNPQVQPNVSMSYVLTATSSEGCAVTKPINVIAQPYAPLNKVPNGGYYNLFNNKMLFKYDGQYAATGLTYKVFNSNNVVVASNTSNNIASSLVVNAGDNRYYLNAASLAVGYYTFEITNEKNEKLYLRFIR